MPGTPRAVSTNPLPLDSRRVDAGFETELRRSVGVETQREQMTSGNSAQCGMLWLLALIPAPAIEPMGLFKRVRKRNTGSRSVELGRISMIWAACRPDQFTRNRDDWLQHTLRPGAAFSSSGCANGAGKAVGSLH